MFDAATRLLGSACPFERELGVNIHAQIDSTDRPFGVESTALLCHLLAAETDLNVVYSALIAFGHLNDDGCIATVLRFADHPDPDIRYGVAFALAGHLDDRTEGVLIRLTTDPHEKVRDWATFALGSHDEHDTPQLRAALRARLTDPDDETRGEALKGLAQRRDPDVIEPLIAELLADDPSGYAAEAAESLADPRLVPALEELARRKGDPDGWLARVIEACRDPAGE